MGPSGFPRLARHGLKDNATPWLSTIQVRAFNVRCRTLDVRLSKVSEKPDDLAKDRSDPKDGDTMAKATINRQSKLGRPHNSKSTLKRVPTTGAGEKSAPDSSQRKSIAELAADQGVKLEGQLERIVGAGADLWANDEEFREFVQGIYDRRREGTNLGKP
jgi:hypothetical protein